MTALFGCYPCVLLLSLIGIVPSSDALASSGRRPDVMLESKTPQQHGDGASIDHIIDRRSALLRSTATTTAALVSLSAFPSNTLAYVRESDQVGYYSFQPPPGFDVPSQKPLKTHLDEVTFKKDDIQFGITVDPLRISRLSDFGTPEQVAAKVVTAEVNRDGVFDVQLMEDPVAGDAIASYYQLNYKSTGKRGVKRFVAKFYVENQKLYALTAQCKEENYAAAKDEILRAVDSFEVTKR